jgi:hypothetical protein
MAAEMRQGIAQGASLIVVLWYVSSNAFRQTSTKPYTLRLDPNKVKAKVMPHGNADSRDTVSTKTSQRVSVSSARNPGCALRRSPALSLKL